MKEMNLVLSSDAKPRLKWTPELHQRFIHAVDKLGGAEKATPKSLMKIVGVHGLTLYHLKSHLQKYRMGKSQSPQNYERIKNEAGLVVKQNHQFTSNICDEAKEDTNKNLQFTEALQIQMEVQRKLHEQIEVQRHLQRRIEAQGTYLQSVLQKAQETLTQYTSCSIEVEQAKTQLSHLMSMVDSGCPSSSFSALAQSEVSLPEDEKTQQVTYKGGSLESSLTSSDSSWGKEEAHPRNKCEEGNGKTNKQYRDFLEFQLTKMHPIREVQSKSGAINNRKSSKSYNQGIDLNSKWLLNDFDCGSKGIDLNRTEGDSSTENLSLWNNGHSHIGEDYLNGFIRH